MQENERIVFPKIEWPNQLFIEKVREVEKKKGIKSTMREDDIEGHMQVGLGVSDEEQAILNEAINLYYLTLGFTKEELRRDDEARREERRLDDVYHFKTTGRHLYPEFKKKKRKKK